MQNPNALLKLKSNFCLEGSVTSCLLPPVFGHAHTWAILAADPLGEDEEKKEAQGWAGHPWSLGVLLPEVCGVVVSAAVILQMASSGLVLSVSRPRLTNTYIPFKNKIVTALNTNVRKLYYLKGSSVETMSNVALSRMAPKMTLCRC